MSSNLFYCVVAIVCLQLTLLVAGQTGHYSCASSNSYTWTSDVGSWTLPCPFNAACQLTNASAFPCATNQATGAFSYSCDQSACQLPDCHCASNTPPFAPSETLQLVMLTFDDAITPTTWGAVQQVLQHGHKNPNGCPMRVTWFISKEFLICSLLKEYIALGHEVASHSVTHTFFSAIDEVDLQQQYLSECGQISRSDITGWRTPNFQFGPWTFQGLDALDMQYDISDTDGIGSLFSPTFTERAWPYTLDYGIASRCWTGTCEYGAKYPGVWSIPMNAICEYKTTAPNYKSAVGVMDLPFNIADVHDYYMNNFNLTYNGNRAPFGIWLHPAWLLADATRVEWLNSFLDQISKYPDVWLVSGQDVINYMKHPVKAGSSEVPFECPKPGTIRTSTPVPHRTPSTMSPGGVDELANSSSVVSCSVLWLFVIVLATLIPLA